MIELGDETDGVNYVVCISDWNGRRKIICETVEEAWKAAGTRTFGGLYEVYSPAGLDCSDFIPY